VLQQCLFIHWGQHTVDVRLLQQVHSHVSHVAVAKRRWVALLFWRENLKAAEACTCCAAQ
jgi:endonuclease/exonuclease/phosphatase (EEP) superfamily protein YafD